ncbi:Dienelactone hydrolase [Parasponia andersonii]|uniref:Carboxymethylenebutenolidase homolog n=1 Tax=Parasponia andersonii TaxID=3476 RepID=A0A2P5DGY9_PARAD|nr:Dienelactone hydrolase [Parasponia andersonii]
MLTSFKAVKNIHGTGILLLSDVFGFEDSSSRDFVYFACNGISKKLGLIGFCFGSGKVIEVLARDQGAYFGVGVSFYGTRIDPSLASNLKAPVLFISGDNDPLCPVSLLKNVEKRIQVEDLRW